MKWWKCLELLLLQPNPFKQHIARPLTAGSDSTLPRGSSLRCFQLLKQVYLQLQISQVYVTMVNMLTIKQWIDVCLSCFNFAVQFGLYPSMPSPLCNKKKKTENTPKTKLPGVCKWRRWLFDLDEIKMQNDISKLTIARMVCNIIERLVVLPRRTPVCKVCMQVRHSVVKARSYLMESDKNTPNGDDRLSYERSRTKNALSICLVIGCVRCWMESGLCGGRGWWRWASSSCRINVPMNPVLLVSWYL